jgi:hypothetical protein
MDLDFNIIKLIRGLPPGRIVGEVDGANQVLEVKAGDLPESFSEGSRLFESSI